MKDNFEVHIGSLETINEFPSGWTTDDYKALLKAINFIGIEFLENHEIKEFLLLELHYLGWEKSAQLILQYKLGEKLINGEIAKIAYEMLEGQIWEEYLNISCHKELFNASSLLKRAFPLKFPTAQMCKLKLIVTAKNKQSQEILACADKVFITRLLLDGMDDYAPLKRLFKRQVNTPAFQEVENIIWKFDASNEEQSIIFTIYSSKWWLAPMEDVDSFESATFFDVVPV